MAALELSQKRLFVLHGILHDVIHTKERSIKDHRIYLQTAIQREADNAEPKDMLSSKIITQVIGSLEECVVGLRDLYNQVDVALAEANPEYHQIPLNQA